LNYNPIEEEEKKWLSDEDKEKDTEKPLPLKHHFAHYCIRPRLYDTIITFGCNNLSLILDAGCCSGEDALYVQRASENIIGVDIVYPENPCLQISLMLPLLTNVIKLPYHSDSFDYVISSGLLHHLVSQGDLKEYLVEFVRVTKGGGYVIALEPNLFYLSGILMNVFNTIKPGIAGLAPHERALPPIHLTIVFKEIGLVEVNCISASYVWNRFPLAVSKFISKYENNIRFKKPFNLFGWFIIIYGQKANAKGGY